MDNELSDFFECVTVTYGIVMEWVMKKSFRESAGIEWVTIGGEMSQLYFADDAALLRNETRNSSVDEMPERAVLTALRINSATAGRRLP